MFGRRALLPTLLIALSGAVLANNSPDTDADVSIRATLNEAQARLLLGVSNKGAGLSLEEGLELALEAQQKAQQLALSSAESAQHATALQAEADALVAELETLVALYEDRFFGVYPLARLLVPTLLGGEGLKVTEQLFHPPDLAAVELAGRGLAAKLEPFYHPKIVLLSSPRDPELESVAFDVLLRAGHGFPENRSSLLRTLAADQLIRLDRGERDEALIAEVMQALDTEVLAVVDLGRASPEGDDLVKYVMSGGVYMRGEAVQGSVVDASPVVRLVTIAGAGTVLDRRHMLGWIIAVELGLLCLCMLWAANINWGLQQRLKPNYRVALGAALFFFGRLFVVGLLMFLQRFMPEPNAMASSALWWPAFLGMGVVLLPGILAWIGQAWLTDIVPGARGARAVGTIFGTTALGAAAYFATPILLMEAIAGFLLLAPLIGAAFGLAVLFGYAARFGPPVPTWFIWGPLVLAPLLGVRLLEAEPGPLWIILGVTLLLLVAASARRRWAVTTGIETKELDHEAAAEHEKEKLDRLRERLKR